MSMLDRRRFLMQSARVAAGALAGSHVLQGLLARRALAAAGTAPRVAAPGEGGYGPLERAGLELALPAGFRYRRLGVMGTLMSDGRLTPSAHDGMAAFALPNGHIRLVRNHEIPVVPLPLSVVGDRAKRYDRGAWGGTTSLEVESGGGRRARQPCRTCEPTMAPPAARAE